MKKQYCYLPNLNSLLLQNSNYQKHRYNVKRSKTTFQHTRSLGVRNKDVQEMHQKVLLLKAKNSRTVVMERPKTPIDKLKQSNKGRIKSETDTPSAVKNSPVKLTPYEKRKLSERNQQNLRMYQALQSSNPVIITTRSKKSQALEQSLRQRASKFSREGNTIVYKFKKTLKDIVSKKRKQKNQSVQPEIREDIKNQLLRLNENNSSIVMLEGGTCSDIYVHSIGVNLKEQSQESQTDVQIKRVSPYRSVLRLPQESRRKKSTKSQHCITAPCDPLSIMTKAKQLQKQYKRMNDIQIVCLPQIREQK